MKVLFQKITTILKEDLSLVRRGILITILLCKDDNSKITLAKCKILMKMNNNEVKRDLIFLHDNKYIDWSGYTKAKITLKKKKIKPDVIEAIMFMNNIYCRNFDFHDDNTTKNLESRLLEYDLDIIKLVIANRFEVWKDDDFMRKYLQPSTIFRPSKFSKYLEDAITTRLGEGIVKVDSMKIKDGDKITIQIANSFIDNNLYNLIQYKMVDNVRVGSGIKITQTGKSIKKIIKSQDNLIKLGNNIEFSYNYRNK